MKRKTINYKSHVYIVCVCTFSDAILCVPGLKTPVCSIMAEAEKKTYSIDAEADVSSGDVQVVHPDSNLKRRLGGKEVQLFAIGGAIGTSTSILPSIHYLTANFWARRLSDNGNMVA